MGTHPFITISFDSYIGQTLSPPEAVHLIGATCSSLTVEWEELNTENHTHFIGYTIRFRAVNGNSTQWQHGNEINDNTFTLDSLNKSTQYEIQVGVAYQQVGGDKDLSVGSGENLLSVLYSESLLATTLPAGIYTSCTERQFFRVCILLVYMYVTVLVLLWPAVYSCGCL